MRKYLLILFASFAFFVFWRQSGHGDAGSAPLSRPIDEVKQGNAPEQERGDLAEPTLSGVLDMAHDALERMESGLDDYTARFVKQEVDLNGVLGDPTEMFLKVRTRFAGPENQSSRRVYMRFISPDAVKGREVIWGEDLYNGKMAVHEVGMILGLKTIWLDPNGMLAMQGQRYPISEIGVVKLVEKLIERGAQLRDDPRIEVTIDDAHVFDQVPAKLVRVRRAEPGGTKDDFSVAEIVFDQQRGLILSYRAYGWPASPTAPPPLLESHSYYDVQMNVGLADVDFQTTNPEYGFPRF